MVLDKLSRNDGSGAMGLSLGRELTELESKKRHFLGTYQRYSRKAGALYVSLLDVRDEVCRQLKLSSILFDTFIEAEYRESIQEKSRLKNLTTSLESLSGHSSIVTEYT